MAEGLVLITGATGHLGFRTLVLLLQAGYRARVAIRAAEQEQRILQARSIEPHASNIEFTIVPDITVERAYDQAVENVDFILHIASPIASNAKNTGTDWNELFYQPAIKGTVGMLSAAKQQTSVKRVVITSSIAVLESSDGKAAPGPYDVKQTPSPEQAKTLNRFEAYTLSKIYSHRAATDFMETNSLPFDLIRVLPGWIQGANELNHSRQEALNGSNRGTLDAALGNVSDVPKLTAQVLLEDVARAHVLSLSTSTASGGDNFIVAGNEGNGVPWDEISPMIAQMFPSEVSNGILHPKLGQESLVTHFNVESSQKALGYRFAGIEEMLESVVKQYLSLT